MTAAFPRPDRPVGITKGPGETIHEYTFISRDEQRLLKNGEYVYYTLDGPASGELPRVMGRILKRVPVQLYPDTFLSEPEVPPSAVASLVGYDERANDLFELHVAIMGYYDAALGTFVNPWIPPQSGTPIYLADNTLLAGVLSKKRAEEHGSAHVGSLLTRASDAVPIVLDVKEMVSTHLAIIASTGAGKSYLASVLVEELMRPYNRAAVLIVDPHGEYGTLTDLPNYDVFRTAAQSGAGNGATPSPLRRRGGTATDGSLLTAHGEGAGERTPYAASTRIYRHDEVKVRLSTLDLGDLRYLLQDLTEKQHYFLGRAYNKLKRDLHGQHWSAKQLKDAVLSLTKEANDEYGEDSGSSTAAALGWKIDSRFGDNTMVFDPHLHLQLRDIFQPGQCTVLQLNEVDDRDQQVIVATILRRLYNARVNTERGKVSTGDEQYLPYPVFVLLEEAHHFAPHGQEVVSTRQLKTVLAEGRKFGIGVGLISQRPGKLDPDVLSQCQTQCIMRIVNDLDQQSVATAVEGVGRDLLSNLPALSKGQAIIAGSAVNTPVICRVRPRVTPHGGESKDAPSEWLRHFDRDAVAARARDSAPIARDDKPFSIFK